MLRSMTAFSRATKSSELGEFSWEIRSVNHRYLEMFMRLPEDLRTLESEVRGLVAQYLNRGKVECSLSFKPAVGGEGQLTFNREMARNLSRLCHDVAAIFSNPDRVSPLEVLKWPGILEAKRVDSQQIKVEILDTLKISLQDIVEARLREGKKLEEAIASHLSAISDSVVQVRKRLPDLLEAVRDRLRKRFEELNVQADPDRLEQEMVMITQRSDVEEELKRLETHIIEVDRIVSSTQYKPVGRRLDFLMQEMNREANTLCSKSMDSETTKLGVDMKVLIEQMREQIQNIE